uniref:P-type phospholipid transporter n=1 Tax=Oryza barthii TaxID=65489 RepID=A0A0D3FUJ5_9ORYZ
MEEGCDDSYCDNRISNTKYNLWNFLPKNLWEQFRRFMNQYFLLIACLQLWSSITPVSPATTWGPLAIIFIVSASKEAWDDYNRYLSDKKANEREVLVIKAQDIHVGNIVWLYQNDEIPCDLVLIGTSDPQGICYVETAALDGETDLKTRIVPSICANLSPDQLGRVKGVVECSNPDNDIRRFDANMRLFPPIIDSEKCPLTINNTLLQSCYLRYTEWACGVAVYTGNQTKSGMSRGTAEPKLTAADAMIDKLTVAIFMFQIVVVLVLGFAGNIWKKNQGLKVTLDLSKAYISVSFSTAISEDLGQVEYVLSDKTGTLTENRMIFRRCCISDILYGENNEDALKDARLLDAVSRNDPDIVKFLMVMALCNTVVPIKSNDGTITYQAQSQDEEALVTAASKLNMVLVSKDSNTAEISFNGSKFYYDLLDILEFTSDRKRMSAVVKDVQSGKILLLSKGADEAILPRCHQGQQIRTYLETVEMYSQLGLRTLCLGWRELEEDEYKDWSKTFQDASCSLENRERKIAEVCHRLEQDLQILGVSAIEDRLQDGVPETIKLLKSAGINVWMLTGDKQHTAIQIGLLCNLIAPEPNGQLLSINGKTEHDVLRSLERALSTMKSMSVTKLVGLLKSVGYLTLAIGDGGNDVRMIQEANIGVGISGREGLQAARAADYSIGRLSGTSLFNSISLMAYNVFYTSLPVTTIIFDKDISEETVLQYPQILLYSQSGRLLNPTTFAGWFGRSVYHALVVFLTTICAYSDEKSEIEELSMVALSGCIWLQAFVVTLDTNSFTYPQIILIWGNFIAFYMINLIVSAVPTLQMYTIMFRLCSQPSYWMTMGLIVAVGMGPVLALRYFRNMFRPNAINILQQIEQSNGHTHTTRNMESRIISAGSYLTHLLADSRRNRGATYQPLLSDSVASDG